MTASTIKLTIEDIEGILDSPPCNITPIMWRKMARDFADTMRENERLREALDTAHKVFGAECDAMQKQIGYCAQEHVGNGRCYPVHQSKESEVPLGSPVRYTDGTMSREYDE